MVDIEMISEKDMYDYFKRMVSDTDLNFFSRTENHTKNISPVMEEMDKD